MSVTVRPYRSGGWEVDITFRLPNGQKHRERSKAPVISKSGALRWGVPTRNTVRVATIEDTAVFR